MTDNSTLLKAIRDNCLWCAGYNEKVVKKCEQKNCPLWAFRLGKDPNIVKTDKWAASMANLQKKPWEVYMNKIVPFMKIKDACMVTGLSQYALRDGCKDGSVPCIRSGRMYLINVPALLEQLDKESRGEQANG